eukprot:403357030
MTEQIKQSQDQQTACSTAGSSLQSPPMSLQINVAQLKPLARVSPLKAKINGNPLKINTYSTVFEQSESDSIIKRYFVPEKATQKERKIHNFLDKMSCYSVNVKTKLEDDRKQECSSPKLQQEFDRVKRLGSPSFLAKRMQLGNATGTKMHPLSTTNSSLMTNPLVGGTLGATSSVNNGISGMSRLQQAHVSLGLTIPSRSKFQFDNKALKTLDTKQAANLNRITAASDTDCLNENSVENQHLMTIDESDITVLKRKQSGNSTGQILGEKNEQKTSREKYLSSNLNNNQIKGINGIENANVTLQSIQITNQSQVKTKKISNTRLNIFFAENLSNNNQNQLGSDLKIETSQQLTSLGGSCSRGNSASKQPGTQQINNIRKLIQIE